MASNSLDLFIEFNDAPRRALRYRRARGGEVKESWLEPRARAISRVRADLVAEPPRWPVRQPSGRSRAQRRRRPLFARPGRR